MNSDYITEVIADVEEMADQFVEGFREQYRGTPYGHRRMNDDVFMTFFLEQVQRNPNWVLMLPLVEGGKEEIERAQRILRKTFMGEVA